MRTVVFDLDGTLADTAGDLIAAANATLAEAGGQPLDVAADRQVAFRGGRAMLRLGLRRGGQGDEAQVDALYPRLLEHYARAICRETVLFPGVVPALESLSERGYGLGICTNKPEGLARRVLEELGILRRFGVLVGADTYPVKKPDPRPLVEAVAALGGSMARCLMLGDTRTDHDTARAAGARIALVTFGAEGPAVAGHGPDALLERFEDLPVLADRLVGPHETA